MDSNYHQRIPLQVVRDLAHEHVGSDDGFDGLYLYAVYAVYDV